MTDATNNENNATPSTDVIGGFPHASDYCSGGCGQKLLVENAWMTDGCPCNAPLGVNSMNETRWRLLMQLQQQQSRELEEYRRVVGSHDGGCGCFEEIGTGIEFRPKPECSIHGKQ